MVKNHAWKGMIIANNINKKMGVDLGETRLTKWLDTYIKFLNIIFKIITGMTISGTFLWFLPTYLKFGWERTGVIVLVVILLQLRYGQTKVKFAE
jgi:hypothetical protein